MSISPIFKGNAPLMSFSFETDSNKVFTLPSDPAKFAVQIHDGSGVRPGAGNIQNINTSARTCQYQAASADTVNTGVATWWVNVDLGEPTPRTFDPQKIYVEDPAAT